MGITISRAHRLRRPIRYRLAISSIQGRLVHWVKHAPLQDVLEFVTHFKQKGPEELVRGILAVWLGNKVKHGTQGRRTVALFRGGRGGGTSTGGVP